VIHVHLADTSIQNQLIGTASLIMEMVRKEHTCNVFYKMH
jgi:hypothetical protein